MMIEVKQVLYLLLYILEFIVCGNFMKRNYHFFSKINIECEEKQILAINVIIYFALCIRILVKAVRMIVWGL